jgi:Tfp pilus assembly protein PilO
MEKRIIHILEENKRLLILGLSLLVLMLLILIVDYPLAKSSLTKSWKVYQLQKNYSSLEALEQKIKEARVLNQALNKRLKESPNSNSIQSKSTLIVELLNQSAKKNKLTVISLNTLPEKESGNNSEIPFELELEGEYHSLGYFLYEIEESAPSVSINSLNLSTQDAVSTKINSKLKINFYSLKGSR